MYFDDEYHFAVAPTWSPSAVGSCIRRLSSNLAHDRGESPPPNLVETFNVKSACISTSNCGLGAAVFVAPPPGIRRFRTESGSRTCPAKGDSRTHYRTGSLGIPFSERCWLQLVSGALPRCARCGGRNKAGGTEAPEQIPPFVRSSSIDDLVSLEFDAIGCVGSSGHVLTSPSNLATFRPMLAELFAAIAPILRHLFPESNPAARWLYPDLDDLLSWTDEGQELYPHHVMIIRYLPGEQKSLAAHIDSSRITLNICLYDTSDTWLIFEDPQDTNPNKAERRRVTCRHRPGWAVAHLGDVWHEVKVPERTTAAQNESAGERWNLVCWFR